MMRGRAAAASHQLHRHHRPGGRRPPSLHRAADALAFPKAPRLVGVAEGAHTRPPSHPPARLFDCTCWQTSGR
eukprot:1074064-Prorocentrum_minimum.AAC.2